MGEQNFHLPGLRRMTKAELNERLHALQQPSRPTSPYDAREAEFLTVLHELEVYQIELEMQNRELRESREEVDAAYDRYVNLYDFAPVGYVTLTDQGVITEINLTAANLLGVERRWLLNRSLAPWVLGSELPMFRSHIKKCRADEEKVTSVFHLVRQDQSSIPVEISSICSNDPISGELLVRTSVTDLSDRRRAEEERDRFFDLSGDLLCVAGMDGYFKRLNPAWVRLLGYSQEELLSRPIIEFIHPDDREHTLASLEKLRRGENMNGLKNRYSRKDRSYLWLDWTGVASGEVAYCVARDTTEEMRAKKAIEDQFTWLNEMILELPVPMVLSEAKSGRMISVSTEAMKLVEGYPINPEDIRESDFYFLNKQGKRLPVSEWPRFRAARGDQLNGEQLIWHCPTHDTHLLIWTRLIPAKYNRPAMVIGMLQNIDPLKQVEKSLIEAISRLKEERDLRETFVSALSHDLRTPLTAARMSAQLLARKGGDALILQKATSKIIENIDRIDHMIRDLLDANRIRAGEGLPIDATRFDLMSLVKATLEELSSIHGPRFKLLSKEKVIGEWDKDLLRRVIENLVNNAVKYGSGNQPISASVTRVGETRVSLAIHNQGNPIPKGDQPFLFEQFRRSRIAEKSGQRGWGVGLTLVRGIVLAHEGEITVSSGPKEGTTFTVLLPLTRKSMNNN